MSGEDVAVADELAAIRQLKARYCRFLLHLRRTIVKVTGGS
jgi:hypothetical protein